jgi:hypothetical protein
VFTREPVVAVDVIAVPALDVLAWIRAVVPVLIAIPAVVLAQMNVNLSPLATAGSVNTGVPLVADIMYVVPERAAVRTTVAPTAAVMTTLDVLPPLNTGAAENVTTPVNRDVLVTARVLAIVTAPVIATVEPKVAGLFVAKATPFTA